MEGRSVSGRSRSRAPLACVACRKRKSKCSGDWPSCKRCTQRLKVCVYAKNNPQAVVGLQSQSAPPISSQNASHNTNNASDFSHLLPSREIVTMAFTTYFDYYGDSIFCFFREPEIRNDLKHGKISLQLQFCVLAVMARFIEPCFSIYNGTIEASEHFVNLARSSMMNAFDEISLLNIQCNLLLCMYWIGHGNESKAWFQLGIAIRIAQTLRLSSEDSYSRENASIGIGEIKRRVFWSCFAIDRLMANGGDRRLTFLTETITTRLPGSRSDFVLGRKTSTSGINDCIGDDESLQAYTLRLIDMLGSIVDWSGAGGRHLENRCPWQPDMPISRFERALEAWREALPTYLQFSDENIAAHVSIQEGKAFCAMHLFYHNALGHIHLEYIPVVPPFGWDPGDGPCDGPVINHRAPACGWWAASIRKGIMTAAKISKLYSSMVEGNLLPWVNPFLGYCLTTSSFFHVVSSLHDWKSCEGLTGEHAKKYLIDDIENLIQFQESWPVAAYWVKSLRMVYEQNSLVSSMQVGPSPSNSQAVAQMRAKLLHHGPSDQEPETWKGHLPHRPHDIFDLFGSFGENVEEDELAGFFETPDLSLLDEIMRG